MEVPASIKFLPNIYAGDDDYEEGFDESLVINKDVGECFLCPLCFGIPRNPVVLKKCGHGFCEVCIATQVITTANQSTKEKAFNTKCHVCSSLFTKFDPIGYEDFNIPSRKAFNLIKIKCPYGCLYIGSPHEMDDHQTYECPKRTVNCPYMECKQKMPFEKLVEEHIMNCENLRIYCEICLLHLRKSDLDKHNCKDRLASALKCTSSLLTNTLFFKSFL